MPDNLTAVSAVQLQITYATRDIERQTEHQKELEDDIRRTIDDIARRGKYRAELEELLKVAEALAPKEATITARVAPTAAAVQELLENYGRRHVGVRGV